MKTTLNLNGHTENDNALDLDGYTEKDNALNLDGYTEKDNALNLDGHMENDNGEQSYLHISKEIACEKVVIIRIYIIVT